MDPILNSPSDRRDSVFVEGEGSGHKRSRFWLLMVLATGVVGALAPVP